MGETRGSSKNVAVALGTASDLIDLSGGGEDDEDDGQANNTITYKRLLEWQLGRESAAID